MPFHNATKGNVMMTNTHNKILLVTGFQNTTSRTRIITPIGTSKEPQNILNQNYVLSLPLAKINPPLFMVYCSIKKYLFKTAYYK